MARYKYRFILLFLVAATASLAASSACTDENDSPPVTEERTAESAAPPGVPPPGKRASSLVKVELEAIERRGELAPGVEYQFWTFQGTVPGPFIRVREGDTVDVTLRNNASNKTGHNIDLHAVNGPGGGADVTNVPPGKEASFQWKALAPGLYVYPAPSRPRRSISPMACTA